MRVFFWAKDVFFFKILQSILSLLLVFEENDSRRELDYIKDPIVGLRVVRTSVVFDFISLVDFSVTIVLFF